MTWTLNTTDLKALKGSLTKVTRDKAQLKDAILTYEKYLELFDNVANLLRSRPTIETMNAILTKYFSNLIVKGELMAPNYKITRWKVVDYKLKEPWSGFL